MRRLGDDGREDDISPRYASSLMPRDKRGGAANIGNLVEFVSVDRRSAIA